MRKTVALLVFAATLAYVQNTSADSRAIASCIRNTNCNKAFIVAHRANGFGEPENSLGAVKKAIEAGVDVIEIDVRRSKDGYLYVLHDRRLNRTASQKGLLARKTSRELEGALLENGETIPMLQDVYDLSYGRAILNLDFKVNAIEGVAEWVHRLGSFDDFIFFVDNVQEIESAAKAKRKYPAMIVMARLKSDIQIEQIEKIFGNLPEIIHADFPDTDTVAWLQAKGVKVFANALGPEKLIWPLNAVGSHLLKVSGANFIQTDYPLDWLKAIKREKRSLERSYNFGGVYGKKLLRSKAPSKEFLQYLQEYYDLKKIIDVRNPNSPNEGWRIKKERGWANELGLEYINMPVISSSAKKYAGEIRKALENLPDGAVLVHCQAGKDRTGAVVAFLRIEDGWTYEKAVREMKKYKHNPLRHEIFHNHLKKFARERGLAKGIDWKSKPR